MLEVSNILAGAIILSTFVLVYKQIKLFNFWKSRGVKGPTPWPFIGTNIYSIIRNRVYVDEEWREKYGRVYGTFEGSDPVLRVTDNELMRFIYIKEFQSFTDRNNRVIHNRQQRKWLFWSDGQHWTNQRVLITPMFTSTKMKQMFNQMLECANTLTKQIDARLKSSLRQITGTEVVSPHDDTEKLKALAKACDRTVFSKDELMSFGLDTIAQTFFSIKLDTYRDKTSDFFKRAFAFSRFNLANFVVWLFIPNALCRYLEWGVVLPGQYEYFERLGQSLVTKRRSNNLEKHNDLIQALLEAFIPQKHEKVFNELDDNEAHYNDNMKHDEMDHVHEKQAKDIVFRRFDDSEITAQMTFFFIAGFETTSSSLSFCFYQFAREQEAQQEVYEELVNSLSASQELDYAKLTSLKKLDAFVAESLRIHVPVTNNTRLVTAKGGITLPTSPPIHLPHGTQISIPGLVVQRDPTYWKDPLKFDMSRFYPENRDKMKTCSYLPFGLGPRNCVGMRFALLNIKTALASTLIKYKVLPQDEERMKIFPPEYNRHAFFLQLKDTNFKLMPREHEEIFSKY